MKNRLSADELAELIGCRPNQRAKMIEWLRDSSWRYDVDRNGLPIVARAYRDRRLGISEKKDENKYADEPNRQAFA